MLDSMFQDGTDSVLDDRVARPVAPPKQAASFSAWNTIKAPVTGLIAGANESVGFATDVLGAFGEVQAGYGLQADPSLLFDSRQRRERVEQGQKSRNEVMSGEAFSTEIGSNLRATARSMTPDADTANVVEQTLFGISRFASKAVGYSVLAGPAVGATLTGADEGMAEADRLKSQGVDIGTRTQVGAVAGLSAAAATALPVAGRTIPQTVGLVAVGGPGGFIAQQAASKAILENADYSKIADQYDPFDPVGLAVSTLVPAAFGGYAMRGGAKPKATQGDPVASRQLSEMGRNERLALKYNDPRIDAYTVTAAQREGVPPELMLALKNSGEKSGPTAVSPKGAQGVAQLMPENQRKYGVTDPSDPIQSIDGMAKYLRDTMKQYDGNIQAVIADYNGGPRQAKRVMQGMQPRAVETIKYMKRVNEDLAQRQGTEAGRAAANDPDAIAAARVNLVKETIDSWNLKDPADIVGAQSHLNAILKASDQLGAGRRVDISDSMTLDNLTQARLFDDMVSRLESQKADLLPDVGNMVDPGVIRGMREELTRLQSERPTITDELLRTRAKEIQAAETASYKTALSTARKEFQARIDETDAKVARLEEQIEANRRGDTARQAVGMIDTEINQIQQARAGVDAPPSAMKPVALAVKRAVAEVPRGAAGSESAKAGTKTAATDAPASGTNGAQSGTEPANAATKAPESGTSTGNTGNALEAQTAEIARLSPDMMVQLEGMDKPMRLADAMEAVKAEAAREAADAPLLQVAAECFLRNA